MVDSGRIAPLSWESAFFGKRIGILELDIGEKIPAVADLSRFDLVQAKVHASQLEIIDMLGESGFGLVETEVSYTYAVNCPGEASSFRVATLEDLLAVQTLARDAFRFSRYRPPWFAKHDSSRLYATWAENAIRGTFDDQCLLIEETEGLLGFVTLRDMGYQSGRIGLLASNASFGGKSLGAKLVAIAVSWCVAREIEYLRVVTQLSNTKALRLYERTGALVDSASYWLYWSGNAR